MERGPITPTAPSFTWGSPTMAPSLSPSDLITRVNRDLERSMLRARNGVRYVRGSSKPKVGATPKEIVWQRDKAQLWRYRGGPFATARRC